MPNSAKVIDIWMSSSVSTFLADRVAVFWALAGAACLTVLRDLRAAVVFLLVLALVVEAAFFGMYKTPPFYIIRSVIWL